MTKREAQAQWDLYSEACLDHDPDEPCVTRAAELTREEPDQ